MPGQAMASPGIIAVFETTQPDSRSFCYRTCTLFANNTATLPLFSLAFNRIFLGVLALAIVAVMKAAEKVEERAREEGTKTDQDANDAATAALTAKGSKGRSK